MASGFQSVSVLNYHLIFATKKRMPIINNEMLWVLRKVFGEKAGELGITIHIMNGYLDHVHLLISVPPKFALLDIVRHLKGCSSFCIDLLSWQAGYSIFTVSAQLFKVVFSYIENQESHHSKVDFSHELENVENILHNF